MSYLRVVPRDLFNEANLLKCYGQIYVNLEKLNLRDVDFVHLDDDTRPGPFNVQQDPASGAIYVANVRLEVRGRTCQLHRPLNSRDAWPLYLTTENGVELAVFTDSGSFSQEMSAYLLGE